MALGDPVRGLDNPRSKISGMRHLGFVVENDDSKHPDGQKRQRIKVRVPGLHRGVPDDKLPWLNPQTGGGAAGGAGNAGDGMGSVNVPALNSKLYIGFENEDPHTGFYSGSPTTDDVNKGNELLNMDYPNTYGYVDQMGNLHAVNTAKKTTTVTHVSGQVTHTDANGKVTIYSPTGVDIVADGDLNLVGKSVNVQADGDVRINGAKVKINGSGKGKDKGKVPKRRKPNAPARQGQTDR